MIQILFKNEHSDLILVLLILVVTMIVIICLLEIIYLLEILFRLWSPLFNFCNCFETLKLWWILLLWSFRSTICWWLDTWGVAIGVFEWELIEAWLWVVITFIVFVEYLRVRFLEFSNYSLSVFDLHEWWWKGFYCQQNFVSQIFTPHYT